MNLSMNCCSNYDPKDILEAVLWNTENVSWRSTEKMHKEERACMAKAGGFL